MQNNNKTMIPISCYIIILCSFIFNQTIIDTLGLRGNANAFINSDKVDTNRVVNIIIDSNDSLAFIVERDIFEDQMSEAKMIYAEAIISDRTGDTLEATYQFDLLFESLDNLNAAKDLDEFQNIELNKLLSATIDYYENEAITIDKVETGLSVAMFRDKLDKYIYSQKLDELEYVEETIELIDGHIPITYNQKVASIIKFFQNDGRKSIQKWLNRVNRYKTIILPILDEEGVPPELFYLAMIESGLNPKAYSYAHASGVWQFIPSTGKIYGLNKSWWIDERRDFEKSTRAAAKYLNSLHKRFDDWYLAFAAYNCGPLRVDKEIRRSGTRDYWKLNRLPRQTRNYVPNIMAAIFIENDPNKYGFTVQDESLLNWKTVEIDKSVSFEVISECSGIDPSELQIYNPEIKQGMIPPLKEGEKYSFRLPLNAKADFMDLLAKIKIEKVEDIVFLDHRVKKGESLWLIARKYDARIQDIVQINKIQNKSYIKPGQMLKIPSDGYVHYRKTTQKKTSQSIFYTVRYGDTLSGIALKYRTSVKKIKTWNGLRNDKIYKGQKLKILIKR